MTLTRFGARGLPTTVGSDGCGKRLFRGTGGGSINVKAPGGGAMTLGEVVVVVVVVFAETTDWKFGRRSSGGITGGTAEMLERCVLVDVWLSERLRGRWRNALCAADEVDCVAVRRY